MIKTTLTRNSGVSSLKIADTPPLYSEAVADYHASAEFTIF